MNYEFTHNTQQQHTLHPPFLRFLFNREHAPLFRRKYYKRPHTKTWTKTPPRFWR